MKLTKQDLMRLPKERLAEIIVELQEKQTVEYVQEHIHMPSPWNQQSYCIYVGGPCKHPEGCATCPYNKVTCYEHGGPTLPSYLKE